MVGDMSAECEVTLNVAGIVGFGEAIKLAKQMMPEESVKLKELRDNLYNGLKNEIPEIELNGHLKKRLPSNLNIYIPSVEARSLIVQLKDEIAISTGSACSTSKVEPSHVLVALNKGNKYPFNSLRFGLGRSNTPEQVNSIIEIFKIKLSFFKSLLL